jgi:hypothetical protein
MDDEPKDVAKGTIIQPNSTIMHHKEMVSEVFKVRLAWVLPGCKDMDPPTQPQGADEHKTIEGCFGWVLTWPKTQIRLVKEQQVTQPPPRMPCLEKVTELPPCLSPPPRRPQQVVSTNTSYHQKLLATALPQPPPAPHGKAVAASYLVLVEDINDDDENSDNWLNTSATDSLFMPNMEEPYRVREDQNAHTKACTRLDFHGALEETPPDAGAADPKVNTRNIFSPNTLHKVVSGGDQLATDRGEQLATGGPIQKKHHRKRNKKDKPSASQQPAGPKRSRVHDDLMSQPAKDTLQGIIHEAGKPIMTEEQVTNASGPMVNLMHGILFLEERLRKETNPSYPVFTVKVLADVGFVDDHPADIFFISYEDVFKLFNAKRLDYNLVCLYAL